MTPKFVARSHLPFSRTRRASKSLIVAHSPRASFMKAPFPAPSSFFAASPRSSACEFMMAKPAAFCPPQTSSGSTASEMTTAMKSCFGPLKAMSLLFGSDVSRFFHISGRPLAVARPEMTASVHGTTAWTSKTTPAATSAAFEMRKRLYVHGIRSPGSDDISGRRRMSMINGGPGMICLIEVGMGFRRGRKKGGYGIPGGTPLSQGRSDPGA